MAEPMIDIEGVGRFEVSPEFFNLPPEQQNATAQEIAASVKQQEQQGKEFDFFRDTITGRIAKSVHSAVTLPRDVIEGKAKLPSSEGIPGSVPYGDPESA